MAKKSVYPYLWMLLGSLAFALMGAAVHALGSCCDWQVIALARTFLPLLFALIFTFMAGAKLVFLRPRILWMRSVAGSISVVCTFFALTRLPVSDVLTLTNMFPIWVAVLSWPLLKELPAGRVWLSVASGIAGVVLIQQPHLAEGNFAALIALISSFSTAVAMIGLHQLQRIHTWAIVAHFSAVSLMFSIGSYFLFEHSPAPQPLVNGQALLMLTGVGVLATFGQLFLTKAFAAGSPAKVSVVGLTQIIFAMVLDVLLWHRDFSPATLLGMVLIVIPTAWLMAQRGLQRRDD